MRAIFAANVLVAALGAGPNFAAADEKACPIARVVARVQSVAGDAQKAEIKRAPTGEIVPATPGACVLYGDRLEAGPEAVVTIETTNGVRHVGGQYDPVFAAPEAVESVSPGVASYVGAFYRSLFAGSVMTAYATGRANLLERDRRGAGSMRSCPGGGVASRPARSAWRDPSADWRRSRKNCRSMETVRATAFGAGDLARERGRCDQPG